MAEEAQNRVGAVAPANEGFPLYRKTPDNKHFYRIEGVDRFTELQIVGSRIAEYRVLAVQYPERLRIAEMIHGEDGRYLAIVEQEWIARRSKGSGRTRAT